MSGEDSNGVATGKQPLELKSLYSNEIKDKSIRFAAPTLPDSTDSMHQCAAVSMDCIEASGGESNMEPSSQRDTRNSGTEHQSGDSTKAHVFQHTISQRKRATIIFQLPGVLPEPDEIAEIWPVLMEMVKRGYNVAINHAKNRNRENINEAATQIAMHASRPVDSPLSQPCTLSTESQIQRPEDDGNYCQTNPQLALFEARVTRLENSSLGEDSRLAASKATNIDSLANSTTTEGTARPHALVRFEEPEQPQPSVHSAVSVQSAVISSFNPPTPYPKIYGELSENGLRVRIAQVHDELRILNLALSRRGSKDTVSEYSSSSAASPVSPEFHEHSDKLHRSSGAGAQDQLHDE